MTSSDSKRPKTSHLGNMFRTGNTALKRKLTNDIKIVIFNHEQDREVT
jgi:hypothetical protein